MSNATEGKRFAHEELRKEVNGAMASEQGQLFLEMFARQAKPTSYPFPSLDFHDTSKLEEAPLKAANVERKASSSIGDLLAVLEETAAKAHAPGER